MFETIDLDPDSFRFAKSLRALLIGSSQTGKTSWIKSFLKYRHRLCPKNYTTILYSSPNLVDSYFDFENDFMNEIRDLCQNTDVIFLGEIPSTEQLSSYLVNKDSKVLLILDDWAEQLWDSESLCSVFVRMSSHLGLDCICSCHYAFGKGRYYSTITKNANLIVLFNCLADRSVNSYIQRKLFPNRKNFLNTAFDIAIREGGPYSYLMFPFNIDNPLNHRFPARSRCFPYMEDHQEKFLPIFFAWRD